MVIEMNLDELRQELDIRQDSKRLLQLIIEDAQRKIKDELRKKLQQAYSAKWWGNFFPKILSRLIERDLNKKWNRLSKMELSETDWAKKYKEKYPEQYAIIVNRILDYVKR